MCEGSCDKRMRRIEVAEYIGVKKGTLGTLIASGLFPKGRSCVGLRCFWTKSEVDVWRKAQGCGLNKEQLKKCVALIYAARAEEAQDVLKSL